jgi:hypothetical protein
MSLVNFFELGWGGGVIMSLFVANYISIPRHPLISATIFADTFFTFLLFLFI